MAHGVGDAADRYWEDGCGADVLKKTQELVALDEKARDMARVFGSVSATVEDRDMTGSWPAVGVAKVPAVEAEDPDRYGLEVLGNGQVAITDAWAGGWAAIVGTGTTTAPLEVATRAVSRMNRKMRDRGENARPEGRHPFRGVTASTYLVCSELVPTLAGGNLPCLLPADDLCHRMVASAKIRPGDVVTIHRGTLRFEVERVELDALASGERLDMALLACIDRDLAPQWVSMDILHVVEDARGDTGAIQLLKVELDHAVQDVKI